MTSSDRPDAATTDHGAPEHPSDAADNTGVGETGSFPGAHGAAKAKAVSQDDGALAEHAQDAEHERTGTPGAPEGAA